jgi:RNA polymerase primary sigma factor
MQRESARALDKRAIPRHCDGSFAERGLSLRRRHENNRLSMATKATERDDADAAQDQPTDGPLLDLTDAAVKRMVKLAKKRGYVTY